MSYTTRALVAAVIPEPDLTQALDDDGDGTEDAGIFDAGLELVGNEIDGYLEGRYSAQMPFSEDTTPAALKSAALALLCEWVYTRRPGNEAPQKIKTLAENARAKLERLQAGKENLAGGTAEPGQPVTAWSKPALTTSARGTLNT